MSAENYLATLTLYRCTVRRNVHFAYVNYITFCKLPTNPNIDLELDCIFKNPMKRRFQRYIVLTEILLTFYARVEYISVTKYAIETNQSMGAKHSGNRTFPLQQVDPI